MGLRKKRFIVRKTEGDGFHDYTQRLGIIIEVDKETKHGGKS